MSFFSRELSSELALLAMAGGIQVAPDGAREPIIPLAWLVGRMFAPEQTDRQFVSATNA